jgi:putative membrane protein
MRIDPRLLRLAASTVACIAFCGLTSAGGAIAGALTRPTAPDIAQSSVAPETSGRSTDQALLKLSAQGNLAEVELGRLAITHSANPAVQSLGTRLAQDGARGVGNLQAVAAMLHMRLPATPSTAQQGQLAQLSQLQGAAFDRQYQRIAREDESKLLNQYQSGVAMASNGAVKAIIEGMIPAVHEHLRIADGMTAGIARVAKAPSITAIR